MTERRTLIYDVIFTICFAFEISEIIWTEAFMLKQHNLFKTLSKSLNKVHICKIFRAIVMIAVALELCDGLSIYHPMQRNQVSMPQLPSGVSMPQVPGVAPPKAPVCTVAINEKE